MSIDEALNRAAPDACIRLCGKAKPEDDLTVEFDGQMTLAEMQNVCRILMREQYGLGPLDGAGP